MSKRTLLGNSSTASERQRLLEQLKKLDQKDEQAMQEREALIGKVVVSALKSNRLSQEDFSAFLEPLVTKKSEAKKLELIPNSVPEAQLDSPELSNSSETEDDSFDNEVSPDDDADVSELEAAS